MELDLDLDQNFKLDAKIGSLKLVALSVFYAFTGCYTTLAFSILQWDRKENCLGYLEFSEVTDCFVVRPGNSSFLPNSQNLGECFDRANHESNISSQQFESKLFYMSSFCIASQIWLCIIWYKDCTSLQAHIILHRCSNLK